MYFKTKHKEMLGFNSLRSYSNIFNFTTSRLGGYSEGSYKSLNTSYYSGDREHHVNKNWNLLLDFFPIKPKLIISPYQTHGNTILNIDDHFIQLSNAEQEDALNGVDALITQKQKVLLTIGTADCVPITFYDPKEEVIGLAHAGWRGTVKGIASKVIEEMESIYHCYPKNIKVCLGPSISMASFEVGNEVVSSFKSAFFNMDSICALNQNSKKYHIDLLQANIELLTSLGVQTQNIECAKICSYKQYKHFFSARRLGLKSGRTLTGIMIKHKLRCDSIL